ncbi:MAG TPA: vanadium-dependent haloperoxidase [Longimicrobiales bacterium]
MSTDAPPRLPPRARTGLPILLLIVVSAAAAVAAVRGSPDREAGPAAVASGIGGSAPGPVAEVAAAWNERAWEIAYAEDQFLTFRGQRALALMNLAMHDALNTISPVYERYAYDGEPRPDADPSQAAAHAAHEILRSIYPGAAARLDSALAGSAGGAGAGAAAALGRAAAATILDARAGDGWDAAGSYAFDTGPGRYRTTPDWNGFVLQPGFRTARPFALSSPSAFRPAPPPALESVDYARAYDEVRSQGAAASAVRTADQTGYAIWWMEFAEGSVNRLARRLVQERDLGLWPAVRLFAHMHMALYDAYIATWDSKYEYDHWRPYTAIRFAGGGNGATSRDPEWQSLRPAPPFPEYVSAHAAGCAAAFTVLASALGDDTPFSMTTITAPPGMPERSFRSFHAAAGECADSRVQLGWHFRYSTDAGLALGERVAAHVLATQLRALQRARGE